MESDITLFDWERILVGLPPPLYMVEILLKILAVFALLLLVLRMLGKRAHHNLSPMQQMLLIALGSAAGDVMLYPEVPLAYTAIILLGVTSLTILLELASKQWRGVRDYVESRPRVLVRNGEVQWDALASERTVRRELFAELRTKGARSLSQVEAAILEVTGDISVFLNDDKGESRDLLDYVLEGDHDRAPRPN